MFTPLVIWRITGLQQVSSTLKKIVIGFAIATKTSFEGSFYENYEQNFLRKKWLLVPNLQNVAIK